MALVSYSDSEASDSEQENVTRPPSDKKDSRALSPNPPKPSSSTPGTNNFQSIVDRSNPRKIRVALPEIKPEFTADGEHQEEPARKKPRIGGGGGGAFSGFNAMLPAPKKNTAVAADKKAGAARKVFSLKTGAEPGFSREADDEMRWEQAALGRNGDDETIPKAGSLQTGPAPTSPKQEEPKLKGNAMMFKPLSVGRNQKKKKPVKATASPVPTPVEERPNPPSQPPNEEQSATVQSAPPKPKVSLFSLSTDEKDERPTFTDTSTASGTGYQPLVYNATPEAPPAGPERPASELVPESTVPTSGTQAPTLDNIADDLNLSRSERRQLLGRHDASSKSRVITFNTDKEYAANQELLHTTDLAAAQHNPVRAIAPGKHTLQQLVNAASTQREALEDSFASGRRNKKEAGSKYGW